MKVITTQSYKKIIRQSQHEYDKQLVKQVLEQAKNQLDLPNVEVKSPDPSGLTGAFHTLGLGHPNDDGMYKSVDVKLGRDVNTNVYRILQEAYDLSQDEDYLQYIQENGLEQG